MKKILQMNWLKPEGLHLRPATQIARVLVAAKSTICFQCRGASVDAKSALQLLTLAVEAGERVEIFVEGEDAHAVSSALAIALNTSVSWE